ncbi:MAG: DUF4038 domain-containing protein [Anaerolineales bacterium]
MTETRRLHTWEKVEITLEAEGSFSNPYTEVQVWVDLEGPSFRRRVYGFWDGGNLFRVRVTGVRPGQWSWVSGSSVSDDGLNGKEGGFAVVPWAEEEKAANPCRRGFLRATENGHALQYADGTPCFLLGDTWWSTATFRYRWYDDDERRPVGPGMGFKDMVHYRKEQGYNCIAILAAFPAWANDGKPTEIRLDDEKQTGVRQAWEQAGTGSAKNMHNAGGRPFFFPGRVPGHQDVFPDVDRINPAYFHYLDRKVDYLNAQGFIPFIEVARRDTGPAWKRFYDWPDSYVRYMHYVFCRYHANNCILSPIHYDWHSMALPSRAYNEPANMRAEEYGPLAFGTPLSANCDGSTLINFGDDAGWIDIHQIGNRRDHNVFWYLTQIYHESRPAKPAFNGEPYYAGWPPSRGVEGGTAEDALYCRSAGYGSFLSGGLAGHMYGADGLWGGDIEPEAPVKMWESLQWASGAQMQHLRTFALSEGDLYQDLVPCSDLVYPNRTRDVSGNRGWAYCAATPDKELIMLYFEADCPEATLRGILPCTSYKADWFDPRQGEWHNAGALTSDALCKISLHPFPSQQRDEDWALKLKAIES